MTGRFVVDANVLLKLVLPEEYANEAMMLTERFEENPAIRWFLPEIVKIEVANGLWKRVKRKEMTVEKARHAFARVWPVRRIEIVTITEIVDTLFDAAVRTSHGALYDCAYLALAIQHNAVFVTADRVFYDKALTAGYKDHLLFIADVK